MIPIPAILREIASFGRSLYEKGPPPIAVLHIPASETMHTRHSLQKGERPAGSLSRAAGPHGQISQVFGPAHGQVQTTLLPHWGYYRPPP